MLISTQTSEVIKRFGFEDGILTLKNSGFDCLDLSLFEMSKAPAESVYLADDWREQTEARRRFADEHGIRFNQSHAPFSFRWADDGERENIAKPRVLRSLEISAIMGVDIVVVHPLHYWSFGGHEEEIHERNLEYYRSLIPVARSLGIRIGLENMWQNEPKRKYICDDVASRAQEHARFIDELDSEYVIACLDLGHVGLVGSEAEDTIRILGHDRLKALHVHDNDYRSDTHTLPGLGLMNWDNIMSALDGIRYDGEFTYEADTFLRRFSNDLIPDALKFMVLVAKRLIAKTSL